MFSAPKGNDRRGKLPKGVIVIEAPKPLEISGVAAITGGFAVVCDESGKHGRVWPGGARFRLPKGIKGPESIDVATGPDGTELWLVLGEKRRTLADFTGGRHVFDERFAETFGRGLEGLAVRWSGGAWQVAVAWEGGFYDWASERRGGHALPRVATFEWIAGQGLRDGTMREFDLKVAKPSRGQRFRAPDLAWDGDGLLVLLASTNARRKELKHTWLQRFDLAGRPSGEPYRLEDHWGAFREGRNWEALDWALDGNWLVLGHDSRDPDDRRVLALFKYR